MQNLFQLIWGRGPRFCIHRFLGNADTAGPWTTGRIEKHVIVVAVVYGDSDWRWWLSNIFPILSQRFASFPCFEQHLPWVESRKSTSQPPWEPGCKCVLWVLPGIASALGFDGNVSSLRHGLPVGIRTASRQQQRCPGLAEVLPYPGQGWGWVRLLFLEARQSACFSSPPPGLWVNLIFSSRASS